MDKRSATIDGYDSIALEANHSDMNKFGSSSDKSYKLVASEIKQLVSWSQRMKKAEGEQIWFKGEFFFYIV